MYMIFISSFFLTRERRSSLPVSYPPECRIPEVQRKPDPPPRANLRMASDFVYLRSILSDCPDRRSCKTPDHKCFPNPVLDGVASFLPLEKIKMLIILYVYRPMQNSILCKKSVQYFFTLERRSARTRRSCEKKYARVAYVILCNFVCKFRHNKCTHGDEKPPPPIRDG